MASESASILDHLIQSENTIEKYQRLIINNTKLIHSCKKYIQYAPTRYQSRDDAIAATAWLIIIIALKQWISQYGSIFIILSTIVFALSVVYAAIAYFQAVYYYVMDVLNSRCIERYEKIKKFNHVEADIVQKLFEPFAYQKIMNRELPTDCPICLEPFDSSQPAILTECTHLFHTKCLTTYLNRQFYKNTTRHCPICRSECVPDHFSYQFNPNYVRQNAYLCTLLFTKVPGLGQWLRSFQPM